MGMQPSSFPASLEASLTHYEAKTIWEIGSLKRGVSRHGPSQSIWNWLCPTEQHLGMNSTKSSRKGTLYRPSFKATQVRTWRRAALAQLTHMEQGTTATSVPHRWVNNRSFPLLPLAFDWGHLTALASAPGASTGLREDIHAASESSGCWRGSSSYHSREGTGSSNGQRWAQNLPVRLCHEIYLWGRNFCFPYVVAFWRAYGHCQPWPSVQSVVVPVPMHHHLQCRGTRPCEWGTKADVNVPVVLNELQNILSSKRLLAGTLGSLWCGGECDPGKKLTWYFFDLKIAID